MLYQINQKPFKTKDQVSVGFIFEITGELIYGLEIDEIKKLGDHITNIKKLSETNIILLDLRRLNRWDSLGMGLVVGELLNTSKALIKDKGRPPIIFIGSKEEDYYKATKDKYFTEIHDGTIAWFESTEAFLQSL